MNYNQNYKIMQITEKTLIVGVDIAKERHYARVFNWRGIELANIISFNVNKREINNFIERLKKIAQKEDKEKIVIGIEPTGHYWYTFAQCVINDGFMLVQVNPYHVKNSKELDDNTPSKSDRKDPKTIAMLIKDGRYQIPYMPKNIYAEIRNANNIREEIGKSIRQIKNRVQRWIDIYFPEFVSVFAKWYGKTALITLEEMPLPKDISMFKAEEILAIWRKEVKAGVGINRAEKLLEAAKESIGIQEGLEFAKYDIQLLITDYRRLLKLIEIIDNKLINIAIKLPGIQNILEIKGIGIKTITGFIAEVGEISRFSHPKQIIKLAGLNVRENTSGKYKGQTKISKRGRKKLRAILFRVILPLIRVNKEFRILYIYYTTRRKNPLKKVQAFIVLCNKLIRIMFKLMTCDEKYNGEKIIEDIKRNNNFLAA